MRMPTVLRRSGPDIVDRTGEVKTPRAMIHFCEDCKYEGAAFLVYRNGQLLSFCGLDKDRNPICANKGRGQA